MNGGAPPNFALVEYEDPSDCEHAIFNMNNACLNNKTIQVHFAKQNQISQIRGQKPVWQTEEYKRTVTGMKPENAGLVKID
jgi:RNA recognition motif-containing protein